MVVSGHERRPRGFCCYYHQPSRLLQWVRLSVHEYKRILPPISFIEQCWAFHELPKLWVVTQSWVARRYFMGHDLICGNAQTMYVLHKVCTSPKTIVGLFLVPNSTLYILTHSWMRACVHPDGINRWEINFEYWCQIVLYFDGSLDAGKRSFWVTIIESLGTTELDGWNKDDKTRVDWENREDSIFFYMVRQYWFTHYRQR